VSAVAYNLLALSDVHLGSDLVGHVRPEAPARSPGSDRRDRALVDLLDWYRERPVDGSPWRLVIGGDFIDFTGMSVLPASLALETEPTEEERAHGLGGAADHALAKLRLVMEHHASVMDALARFLGAGHQLVIVPGNHDADWHWESVQAEFRDVLATRAHVEPSRIEFSHWFYYEAGLIYLEHGHQYDAYCSHDHVLFPVSPSDPRRTTQSLSDILVRWVVRPTRGMTESGHDVMGVADYLRFAGSLGVSGMASLVRRFALAIAAAIGLWREHASHAAAWVRREHERKLQQLSHTKAYGIERLRDLVRLQHPPLTRSLRAIASSLMLDQVALALAIPCALTPTLLADDHRGLAAALGLSALAAAFIGRHLFLRRHSVEPSALLREGSAGVARLFPAAVIVMGHTHLPEVRPLADASTYINLGAWAGDPTAPESHPGQTHLVLTRAAAGPSARLLTWSENGPRPFSS
jgi:UDP-2,3-diacylglucosamine pyrophosphatase LpxH